MREKGRFIVGWTALLLLGVWSLQAAEPGSPGLQDNLMEGISKKAVLKLSWIRQKSF